MGAMVAKAKSSGGSDWEFPSWFTKLLVAAVIGYFGWQAQRVIVKLDALSERVAVVEERVPQPLSKELAPLTEEVRKLALEVAELRGQLAGDSPARSD